MKRQFEKIPDILQTINNVFIYIYFINNMVCIGDSVFMNADSFFYLTKLDVHSGWGEG